MSVPYYIEKYVLQQSHYQVLCDVMLWLWIRLITIWIILVPSTAGTSRPCNCSSKYHGSWKHSKVLAKWHTVVFRTKFFKFFQIPYRILIGCVHFLMFTHNSSDITYWWIFPLYANTDLVLIFLLIPSMRLHSQCNGSPSGRQTWRLHIRGK